MEEGDHMEFSAREIEELENDTINPTNCNHKLDKEHVEKLRQATLQEIEEKDKLVEKGMRLFFMNKVKDAEDIMNNNAPLDPLHALGACCLAALKSLLSMGVNDTKYALEKADFSIAFSTEVATIPKGFFGSVTNLFWGTAGREFQPGMFRAKTIRAQSFAVRGILLISQQGDMMALLRGGMALKNSYKLLQSLKRELEDLKKKKDANSYEGLGADRNSVYGLLLMVGVTHVVISLLPSRVLSILGFLGLKYDRKHGMKFISMTWESRTLFAPFAALFLMVITSFVPGFCPLHVPGWLPAAKAIAEHTVDQPPMGESLLHLWILGRIKRLEQDVEGSMSALSKCLKAAEEGQVAKWMPQLRDFAIYDQGWNFIITMQWREAIELYKRLEDHSAWSKLFYGYAQACCFDMLALEAEQAGNKEGVAKYQQEASEALWRTAHYRINIMGGRAVSVEEFVSVRLGETFKHCGIEHPNKGNKRIVEPTPFPLEGLKLRNPVRVGVIELLALFDITHQMPQSNTEKFLDIIDRVSKKCSDSPQIGSTDDGNGACGNEAPAEKGDEKNIETYTTIVCAAVKANLLCRIESRREEASACLDRAVAISSKYKREKCSVSWVRPQMIYEQAVLASVEGDEGRMNKLLDKVKESNHKRLFQNVMDVKLHLTEYGKEAPVVSHII
ncbi:hypothetical protein, conserved [Trypanosoma brucei gambiense DAL972]|uniref:Uncharacterized protein n=1 Tax=Trypanosoma brucei gambiense (strain MHOM/CI/86/DAL972) TaxID=679716 RepID=C9ZMS0_TRYB9|nr:hypothetical protein, conserved [Trypanosoma brucei gambiense DAL972]CBH10573.1 hypothetical protein, conserved [Trypanosoma brucei gambiense DAL972]|eukprot:XP_011772862.1 hypothetical protein, conserved [Trypanosoma brucei gambiense DAL972]